MFLKKVSVVEMRLADTRILFDPTFRLVIYLAPVEKRIFDVKFSQGTRTYPSKRRESVTSSVYLTIHDSP